MIEQFVAQFALKPSPSPENLVIEILCPCVPPIPNASGSLAMVLRFQVTFDGRVGHSIPPRRREREISRA